MTRFEYMRLDLNLHSPRQTELDLLADAGDDGWELRIITASHIAYFMRAVALEPPAPAKVEEPAKPVEVVKKRVTKSR